MLSELKQYAEEHCPGSIAGYKRKTINAYVHLSASGDYIGIETCEKNTSAISPDLGSKGQGSLLCNFLVEKADYPLCMSDDKNTRTKYRFYLSTLDAGSAVEPKFCAIADALRSEATRGKIIDGLKEHHLSGKSYIGFVVDGTKMEGSHAYRPWWDKYRLQFTGKKSKDLSRCLITGTLTVPMDTVPKVRGLMQVGGRAEDAFLCFDKAAYESYGLEKSFNAPVSEEAMTAVNAALTELIRKAPVFGGAKLVHWYQGSVPEQADIVDSLLEGLWEDEPPTAAGTNPAEQERQAMQAARQFLESVRQGNRPERLSARYYIMPLSGAGGRMMVRGWHQGSFEELYANIDQWFADLRLIRGKDAFTRPPKLKALCIRLLKPGGDASKVYDRMDSELANLSGRLFSAIIHNDPLPDEVASRALRYIRSMMLAQTDEGQRESPLARETLAFQLLKAWLVRHQRQRGDTVMIGESVSTSPKTPAYCCGQLMAVYSAIQSKAMPEVNVSVAQRYYAAASTTPAFVIGKLAQLSQHHLAKLDTGLAIYYQKLLGKIYDTIGNRKIPTTLNMEQQTEFALGYYQQRVAIFTASEEGE